MGSPRSWSGVIDANDAVDSRSRGKQARAGLRLALASHCRLDLKRIAPPTTLPPATQFPSTVALTGSDGSSATALLSSASPNVKLKPFRVDPNGDWAERTSRPESRSGAGGVPGGAGRIRLGGVRSVRIRVASSGKRRALGPSLRW